MTTLLIIPVLTGCLTTSEFMDSYKKTNREMDNRYGKGYTQKTINQISR